MSSPISKTFHYNKKCRRRRLLELFENFTVMFSSIAEQRDTTSTLTTAHHHNITLGSVPLNKRTFLNMQDGLDLMLILASMKLREREVTWLHPPMPTVDEALHNILLSVIFDFEIVYLPIISSIFDTLTWQRAELSLARAITIAFFKCANLRLSLGFEMNF